LLELPSDPSAISRRVKNLEDHFGEFEIVSSVQPSLNLTEVERYLNRCLSILKAEIRREAGHKQPGASNLKGTCGLLKLLCPPLHVLARMVVS